jgi:hypothetical protein
MSLADEIREFVDKRYLTPAREAGRLTVTINAGNVHREMALHNRLPAVCGAMRSQKLLHASGTTLLAWEGPSQGASVKVTYSFAPERTLPEQPTPVEVRTMGPTTGPSFTTEWSPEIPLDSKSVSEKVPHQPGVYKLLQSGEYHRYLGSTRVLKIGRSARSLQKELLNHLSIHTAANRLARIIGSGAAVSVVFTVLPTEAAKEAESRLLREFEDLHWDVPTLNSQRGYARGEDSHYAKRPQRTP